MAAIRIMVDVRIKKLSKIILYCDSIMRLPTIKLMGNIFPGVGQPSAGLFYRNNFHAFKSVFIEDIG